MTNYQRLIPATRLKEMKAEHEQINARRMVKDEQNKNNLKHFIDNIPIVEPEFLSSLEIELKNSLNKSNIRQDFYNYSVNIISEIKDLNTKINKLNRGEYKNPIFIKTTICDILKNIYTKMNNKKMLNYLFNMREINVEHVSINLSCREIKPHHINDVIIFLKKINKIYDSIQNENRNNELNRERSSRRQVTTDDVGSVSPRSRHRNTPAHMKKPLGTSFGGSRKRRKTRKHLKR